MANTTTRRAVLTGLAALAAAPLVSARATAAAAGWTVHDFPPRPGGAEQRVTGIFAPAGGDAWSIGVNGTVPVVGRWNGSAWHVVDAPAVGGDIAGTAPNDVWIGRGAKNMHWDGASWTVQPVPSPPPDELYVDTGNLVSDAPGTAWATSATASVFGSGPLNYRVTRWTGAQWQLLPAPPQTNLGYVALDLDVTGAAGAWVVGTRTAANRTLVAQWLGNGWFDHVLPVTAGSYVYPHSVVALAPTDVWIAGSEVAADSSSTGYLARWNGSTWTRLAVPSSGREPRLYDVGGVPLLRAQVWTDTSVVDSFSRWTGSGWQDLPKPPIRVFFTGLRFTFAAAPGGGIWASGGQSAGGRVVPATALYL
ncbi:hypothetical protein ACI2LF_06810 [Kribbella sp. NPDC020789]